MGHERGTTDYFSFSGHGDSQELGGNDGLIPVNSMSARITPTELEDDLSDMETTINLVLFWMHAEQDVLPMMSTIFSEI